MEDKITSIAELKERIIDKYKENWESNKQNPSKNYVRGLLNTTNDVTDLINSFEAELRRDAKDERIAEVVRNYIKRRVLGEEEG